MKWLGQCTCNYNKRTVTKSRNHTVNKLFCLCIPTDGELSNRLLLSLHSIIAPSVYPSLLILETNIHTILSNHSNDNILQTQIRPDS